MGRRAKGRRDEPFFKVMRPLVEAYFAFVRVDDRRIRDMGLTSSQFDVLATLGNTAGMTCGELSGRTLVTKGTLTGVLDRLEGKGILERVPSKSDRRSLLVRLTTKGDALFRETFPAQIAHLRPYFERALTPREMTTLGRLLLKLKASFDGEPVKGESR